MGWRDKVPALVVLAMGFAYCVGTLGASLMNHLEARRARRRGETWLP